MSPARLFETVKTRRDWGEATIKTLIGRLMRKKAIRSERDDGRLLYHPLLTRQDYVAGEVEDLVGRLFDGDPGQLVDHLTGTRDRATGVPARDPPAQISSASGDQRRAAKTPGTR